MAFVRVGPVGSSKGRRCPLVSACRTLALEGRSSKGRRCSNVGLGSLGAVGLSPAISVASTWGLPVQGAGRQPTGVCRFSEGGTPSTKLRGS